MKSKTVKYLLSTFFCSWILWGIVALSGKLGVTWLEHGSPIGMLLFVIAGISPAICGILIQKSYCNKLEFKRYLKNIVNPKVNIWLYMYAIGGAILIQSIPVLAGYATTKYPFYMGVIFILPMVIGGGIEEIGWRGLLQLELEKKLSHLIATLAVGFIWSLWHLPLWFIDGTSQQNVKYIWFFINALTFSFFIGSVRYISGSILLAILSHATINAFWEVIQVKDKILPSLVILALIGLLCLVIDSAIIKKINMKFK